MYLSVSKPFLLVISHLNHPVWRWRARDRGHYQNSIIGFRLPRSFASNSSIKWAEDYGLVFRYVNPRGRRIKSTHRAWNAQTIFQQKILFHLAHYGWFLNWNSGGVISKTFWAIALQKSVVDFCYPNPGKIGLRSWYAHPCIQYFSPYSGVPKFGAPYGWLSTRHLRTLFA